MYLKIIYGLYSEELPQQELNSKNCLTPFNSTDISKCAILDYKLHIDEESRKVYELKISRNNILSDFKPGYTIGVLPSNDENEVNQLIIRLGLEKVADLPFELNILKNTKKKNPCVPKHIPKKNTIRNVFLNNLDIRSAPKKLFLKTLLEFIEEETEYKELEHMISPKGTEKYNKLISSYSERSLLGLLNKFSSCKPPIEVLFEYIPPLFPRPYSISSSPLNTEYFTITFNVDTFCNNQQGVCTNWLEKCISTFDKTKFCEIPLYLRIPTQFQLPSDNTIPIILIATGTGLAPFKGFLEHRHILIDLEKVAPNECWLFFGGRDSKKNYLYKDELKMYLKSGALTNLHESFSRENGEKNYVQSNIERYGKELNSLIVHKKAYVYVCGEYSKVIPSVRKSIIKILIEFNKFSEEVAENYLKDLEKEHRYNVDNWI